MQPYAGDDTQWLAEQHMPMGELVMTYAHTCTVAPHATNKHSHTAGRTHFCQGPFVMLLCLQAVLMQRLSSGPITVQSLCANELRPVESYWSSLARLSLLSTHAQLLCSNAARKVLQMFVTFHAFTVLIVFLLVLYIAA